MTLPLSRSPYAVGLRAQLDCPPVWRTQALAALAVAGITVEASAPVGISLAPGREVSPTVDDWSVASLPHLLVGVTPWSVEVGPWAAPGVGPCARCVAAAVLDDRPATPRGGGCPPAARPRRRRGCAGPGRLGRRGAAAHLADVVAPRPPAAADGAAVGAPPLLRLRLVRHGLTGAADHHHSLSSLPSIARRFSREQLTQKRCWRPRSTAVVQLSVSAAGAWAPQ